VIVGENGIGVAMVHRLRLAMAAADVLLLLRVMVRARRRRRLADRLINDKANRPVLTQSLAALQESYNTDVLVDNLSTRTLPVDVAPQLVGDVALGEKVVGNVCQLLALELSRVRLNALHDDGRAGIVGVDIAEPQRSGDVSDDESQGRVLALADTLLEEVVDVAAAFDPHTVLFFPVRTGAVLGIDPALLEDVVEDLLQVTELVTLQVEVNELSGVGLVGTRGLVVGEPNLVVAGHVDF
jgi:hypothetical protein